MRICARNSGITSRSAANSTRLSGREKSTRDDPDVAPQTALKPSRFAAALVR